MEIEREPAPLRRVRLLAWAPCLSVALVTIALSSLTTYQALARYAQLRTGWSWDLAYYNQWFWALTQGDQVVTVRPISSYATEGPSVWKMNYLTPARLAIVPIYVLFPGPRTLLVIENVVFWLLIPASFSLLRSETRSNAIALSGTALVPLTPLLWPLAWNDFRELQLAIPFVLWGIQGVRGRNARLSAIGIGGMLACRQEYAIVVATFSLIPPREPEDVGRTYRWVRATLLIGLGWFLVGFFGYLRATMGPLTPGLYLQEFRVAKAPIGMIAETTFDLLAFGIGSWALFAAFSPRIAILALPWIWGMCSGRWSLRFLATEEWHHVRYTAPIVALALGAGLMGYGRVARWCLGFRRGRWILAIVWLAAAGGSLVGLRELTVRMRKIPPPVAADEVQTAWRWINEVAPDDGVLATYSVSAPLSSRRELYSHVLYINLPKGFPTLAPNIRWLFYETARFEPESQVFRDQGFSVVHSGASLTILKRANP